MAKKKQSAAAIEQEITEMQERLKLARVEEAAAEDQELIRLVRRAGIYQEVIALAKRKLGSQRSPKSATAATA